MALEFLVLEQVSVSPGGVVLLDRLDWTIRRGEQWAITGPSGSGKTVLAHTLMGKHFYTGEIHYFFGEDGEARRVAMVEQQHRFKNRPGATDL